MQVRTELCAPFCLEFFIMHFTGSQLKDYSLVSQQFSALFWKFSGLFPVSEIYVHVFFVKKHVWFPSSGPIASPNTICTCPLERQSGFFLGKGGGNLRNNNKYAVFIFYNHSFGCINLFDTIALFYFKTTCTETSEFLFHLKVYFPNNLHLEKPNQTKTLQKTNFQLQ